MRFFKSKLGIVDEGNEDEFISEAENDKEFQAKLTYTRDFVLSKDKKSIAHQKIKNKLTPFTGHKLKAQKHVYKQRVKPLSKGEDVRQPFFQYDETKNPYKTSFFDKTDSPEVSIKEFLKNNKQKQRQNKMMLSTDSTDFTSTKSERFNPVKDQKDDSSQLKKMVQYMIKQSRSQDPNWYSKDYIKYVYQCDNYRGKGGNMNKTFEKMLRGIRNANEFTPAIRYFMKMKRENCKIAPNNYTLFVQTSLVFQLLDLVQFLLDEMDRLNHYIQNGLLQEFMALKLRLKNKPLVYSKQKSISSLSTSPTPSKHQKEIFSF